MFLKDGTTLRSSAIRELSFEKHADTPERAEAPSRSLELHVTNPRRKDDCGGQPAIEAQTLLPRDLILALQGALRPSAAHVLRLRRVQLLAGSWGNVACGWKWRASWQRATAVPEYWCAFHSVTAHAYCSKRAHPFAVVLLPGHAVMLPGPSAPRRAAQRRQHGRQRARGDEEER